MPAPPITVQLSKFEQIEILRLELGEREEELRQTESKIRDILFEIERLKYLRSLHALYQKQPEPQEAASLPELQSRREALREALDTLQAALSALERETAGQTPPAGRVARPPSSSAADRSGAKRRFESFEDFRANR